MNEIPLGNIITSANIRRIVYSTYGLLTLAAALVVTYDTATHLNQPLWLTGVLAVLAGLGAPIAALAVTNTQQETNTMTEVDTTGRIIGDPNAIDDGATVEINGKQYVRDGDNYVPAPEPREPDEPDAPEPVEIGGEWYVRNAAGGYDLTPAPVTKDPGDANPITFTPGEPGVNP